MQKRPLSLLVCSLLFLFFPLEFAWRVYFRDFPYTPGDIVLNVALPLVLLVGLIRVTRVGWYTLVMVIALSGVRDLHDYYITRGASLGSLATHLLIYAISLSYFVNPRIRHLYFDPKSRWWRTKPRFETHLPIVVENRGQWSYPILRNISEGGCFVESPHVIESNESLDIAIPLPIPLNVSVIKAKGEVRWASHNALRPGYGVQFVGLSPEQQLAVTTFVKRQL